MDQGHIIFRVLHHENISITMDAGVSLFFGLHGQYTISTAQESYTVGASEVYAVSPFTLYRAVSGENAGVLQITLSPEILQKADWSPRQMIDCYLSRSTLKDSVAPGHSQTVCDTVPAVFSADQSGGAAAAGGIAGISAVEPVFHSGLGSAGREHQHTETAGICTENDPYAVESVDFTVRDGSTAVCVGKLYLACVQKVCGDHIYQVSG